VNFDAFADRLTDRRIAGLTDAVAKLEAGIAAGVVRNADFVSCKEAINWAVDTAYDHYQDEYRDYGDGPLVMGAYNVPSAIKYATKNRPRNYLERLAVLTALLPLHELIQRAKLMVVKRQTGPGAPKTAKQLEREACTMTCQCCGGRYLANTGTIAHHGYQRPGDGWQTASCIGAKFEPFEVSRERLYVHIKDLKGWEVGAVADRKAVADETEPVSMRFNADRDHRGHHHYKWVDVTRDTFPTIYSEREGSFRSIMIHSFDALKSSDLGRRDHQISRVSADIKAQEERYDGWKQTHTWNAGAKEWETAHG
jgi:hypothetical protein